MENANPHRDYGKEAPPVRYPDPDLVSLDPRFDTCLLGNAAIERIATGFRWAEGPAWSAVGKYLLWSDIPSDVQMRWLMEDGHVSTFRNPSNYSNGNTFDFEGRQIACEHATRRVVRYEHSGAVTVLADRYDGKPLNAPNDVVVHPDGGIWFTDPGYGAMWEYEGGKADLEMKEAVYRIDPATGAVEKKIDELDKPNGLCFDPGYQRLYVVDTGTPQNIMTWNLIDGVRVVTPGRVFTEMAMEVNGKTVSGGSDGIRCDTDGNVWSAATFGGAGFDGVHIFAPDGTRIGQIRLPECCSNLCFGGRKRNRLFMTASQSVYAVYVNTQGAHIT
jgi:gluconolactonase